MPWIIRVWIPAEIKDPQRYDTKEFADKDIESMKLMSPENVYEAVEVEEAIENIIISMESGLIHEIEGQKAVITIWERHKIETVIKYVR